MTEYQQGRGIPPPSPEMLLAITQAFEQAGISRDTCLAFHEHMLSRRGQLQRMTVVYALAFAHVYDQQRARGADAALASGYAYRAAVNARAAAGVAGDTAALANLLRMN